MSSLLSLNVYSQKDETQMYPDNGCPNGNRYCMSHIVDDPKSFEIEGNFYTFYKKYYNDPNCIEKLIDISFGKEIPYEQIQKDMITKGQCLEYAGSFEDEGSFKKAFGVRTEDKHYITTDAPIHFRKSMGGCFKIQFNKLEKKKSKAIENFRRELDFVKNELDMQQTVSKENNELVLKIIAANVYFGDLNFYKAIDCNPEMVPRIQVLSRDANEGGFQLLETITYIGSFKFIPEELPFFKDFECKYGINQFKADIAPILKRVFELFNNEDYKNRYGINDNDYETNSSIYNLVNNCLVFENNEIKFHNKFVLYFNTYFIDFVNRHKFFYSSLFKSIHKIHRCKILHKDLKSDNIFYKNENGTFSFRFIDFGLSTTFSAYKERMGEVIKMSKTRKSKKVIPALITHFWDKRVKNFDTTNINFEDRETLITIMLMDIINIPYSIGSLKCDTTITFTTTFLFAFFMYPFEKLIYKADKIKFFDANILLDAYQEKNDLVDRYQTQVIYRYFEMIAEKYAEFVLK